MNSKATVVYVNNTNADLRAWHAAIVASLAKDGALPEELADLFVVAHVEGVNADGSPRFIIDEA